MSGADLPDEFPFVLPKRRCRLCQCTDLIGCPEGCSWVADDLCSSCAEAATGAGCPHCGTPACMVIDAQRYGDDWPRCGFTSERLPEHYLEALATIQEA